MTNYKEEYQHWLDSPALSEEEWKELNSISGDEKEIESRFFAPLEFGTAGLRGTMKLGLHNMNIHIIRHATQAFANVILEEGMDAAERGIAIAHDCRINSRRFAEEAACVMAANGIHVRFFESLRPTPELSFAILHYGLVTSVPFTHGGFLLYNGGFTAALICFLFIPVMEMFFRTKEERKQKTGK